MKVKNNQEILKPKNLWIADTKICTIYNQVEKSRTIHSKNGRKSIAVIYTGDAFIELSTIPENLKLSRCHILGIDPVRENEEYVDLKTLQPFPYEEWFDLKNVTLESLKEIDTVRQMRKYLQQNKG